MSGFERKMSISDISKTNKCSVKYFYVSNKGATPRKKRLNCIFMCEGTIILNATRGRQHTTEVNKIYAVYG